MGTTFFLSVSLVNALMRPPWLENLMLRAFGWIRIYPFRCVSRHRLRSSHHLLRFFEVTRCDLRINLWRSWVWLSRALLHVLVYGFFVRFDHVYVAPDIGCCINWQ